MVDRFAGKKIECPCTFVSGKQDWDIQQESGVLDTMTRGEMCSGFWILCLLDGVCHWVPQESPNKVVQMILELVKELERWIRYLYSDS